MKHQLWRAWLHSSLPREVLLSQADNEAEAFISLWKFQGSLPHTDQLFSHNFYGK